VAVTDEDITRMWLDLASVEGIFCEPSSAAGLAALSTIDLEPGSTVVCVLTGHGLKDTAAVDVLTEPAHLVEPTVESILAEVSRAVGSTEAPVAEVPASPALERTQ
jgi:threonine synthase